MYTMVTSSSAKRSWYDPWALSILCFFANASLDWRVLLAQATTCEPLCLRQFVKSLEIFPHPRIPHLDAIAPCSGAVLLCTVAAELSGVKAGSVELVGTEPAEQWGDGRWYGASRDRHFSR